MMNIKSALQASIFIVFVSLIMSACDDDPSVSMSTPPETVTTPLPHSFKGYELYSWPVNDQWCFTLITGTNRTKSLEEIISNENIVTPDGWVKISALGVDSIKDMLNRLPQHEEIFWPDKPWFQADQIKLPPQEIIDDTQEYCKQLGLELHVVK